MSISLFCGIVAVILFGLAAVGWRGWALPVGLMFLTLAHILAGVAFKAV